ncbi:MAG: PTS sugar transporter subunit IIA [Anaerolineales bacterium]|nr:PTS sugar transporter subunit IIA [Anaerolineales bacterium]MCB8937929.1 PTS sugar transporter subunit IIA [Ardenticatenaceae bacterium]
MAILEKNRIKLGATAVDKQDAIRQAGALLVKSGCVDAPYVDGMLARETTMSTYLGNGVAIPHGQYENRGDVKQTGISVLQVPAGIVWDEDDEDELAYLVIGIAAIGDEHMDVLANLAEAIEDPDLAEELARTTDVDLILNCLNGVPDGV